MRLLWIRDEASEERAVLHVGTLAGPLYMKLSAVVACASRGPPEGNLMGKVRGRGGVLEQLVTLLWEWPTEGGCRSCVSRLDGSVWTSAWLWSFWR